MNARLSVFDSPLFLGFDQIEKSIERIRKTTGESYPPYNIEQVGDAGLRITLAVAGFTMNDLDIELDKNQLNIRGRQTEEEGKIYLHRGIAARAFQRSFVLAEGIEIMGAFLDNGLLHVDMKRNEPVNTVRKIQIAAGRETGRTLGVSGVMRSETTAD